MTDPLSSPARPTNPHAALAAEGYRRSRGVWRAVAFVAIALVIIVAIGRFTLFNAPATDYVARVEIDGLITTDAARLETINRLAEDDTVKAVIVSINSGGGTTAGGEELYEALGKLREVKPTVAVIKETGASAAYMTAIATNRIFARRLSIVGSIGVLWMHVNVGKLLETIGVDYDKLVSGPLKAAPEIDEPMAGAPRMSLQALVDDSFQWFVDIVAERRQMPRPQALALADGRIMTGRTGVESGLIDAIGGELEALAWLTTERDVPEDLAIHTVWPLPQQGFDLLGTFINSQARTPLGLPEGPIALDGLVSLWQVDPTR